LVGYASGTSATVTINNTFNALTIETNSIRTIIIIATVGVNTLMVNAITASSGQAVFSRSTSILAHTIGVAVLISWTIRVYLTLRSTFASSAFITDLPVMRTVITARAGDVVFAVNIDWEIAHRPHGKLVSAVERETIITRAEIATGCTVEQASFPSRSTLPEFTAVIFMEVVVRFLCDWVNKS